MTETLDIPADASQEIIVPADQLTDLLVRMLKAKGMYEAEARIGARGWSKPTCGEFTRMAAGPFGGISTRSTRVASIREPRS